MQSEKIGYAVYSCDWIGKSPMMLKDVMIILYRARQPMVISVSGIIPDLSLQFYGSVCVIIQYLSMLIFWKFDRCLNLKFSDYVGCFFLSYNVTGSSWGVEKDPDSPRAFYYDRVFTVLESIIVIRFFENKTFELFSTIILNFVTVLSSFNQTEFQIIVMTRLRIYNDRE